MLRGIFAKKSYSQIKLLPGLILNHWWPDNGTTSVTFMNIADNFKLSWYNNTKEKRLKNTYNWAYLKEIGTCMEMHNGQISIFFLQFCILK